MPPCSASGGRLLRMDAAEQRAGAEERERVDDQRSRPGDDPDEEPRDRRAGDEGERAAAVQQSARVDEALPRDDRLEERRVRDVEQHRERPRPERDRVELRERERVEERMRRARSGAATARPMSQAIIARAALSAPVDPGAGVEREEKVGASATAVR